MTYLAVFAFGVAVGAAPREVIGCVVLILCGLMLLGVAALLVYQYPQAGVVGGMIGIWFLWTLVMARDRA